MATEFNTVVPWGRNYNEYIRMSHLTEYERSFTMGITLIIVGGLVLMTAFAAGFDYLSKRRKRLDDETKTKVAQLEKKVAILESIVNERDNKIEQLEENISFVTKLIEKK